MNRFLTILIVALAASAQAGEVTIVETDSGVTAELTGSPSSTGNSNEMPGAAVNIDNAARVKFLSGQIEQLKKEIADISQLTGNETEEELTQKNALADEKKLQIETYTNEYRQLAGNTRNTTAGTDQPKEEQTERYQSYRQERKSQIRELKKLRATSP